MEYCEICRTQHAANEFETTLLDTTTSGDMTHKLFAIKCLRTGESFQAHYDEPTDDDDD